MIRKICTSFVPIEKRFMKAYEGQTPRGGKPRGSFRMAGGTMVQEWCIWRESGEMCLKSLLDIAGCSC